MRKKRITTTILAAIMAISTIGTTYAATGTKTAVLNNAKVRFNNGVVQTVQCYNVDGYNFVRARDVTNNLNMWIDTIGKNKPGVVVATYSTPVSTGKLETLTQKKAKVNVVNGRILYEGWESPAECFLLNGRYYFKLADFEKASDHYYDICFEIVERKAKNPTIKEYGGSKTSGITVEWNNNTKVIDVNRIEVDLPQLFKDIRVSEKIEVEEEVKYPVKEDINKEENKQDKETVIEKEERIKGTGILKSAPKEGKILANILKDKDEGAYLDNGRVNWENIEKPYTYYSEKNFGQCTWYAHGRFIETYGDIILANPYQRGKGLADWIEGARSENCPDLDSTTDAKDIVPGCIAVWEGHVAFVEWVDYDRKGNPETVYYTEGNSHPNGMKEGVYYPDHDGRVQVEDFEDFTDEKSTDFVGYIIVKGSKKPVIEETKEKFEVTGILTSAPKEGEVLANILIDEDEGAYLDNGSVNRDNFTYPYTLYPDSHVGQCTWYAEGRFMETTGVDMKINNLTGGSVAAWVKSAKSDECPDLDGTTDPYEIEAGCMGIFKGHALFVEWVDFDRYGNPETVYFTEGNTQHVGKYYPEYDAKVQVMDFEDFIERQPFVGYVVAK